MKPIDRLALWLRQRAAEGLPMLQDREIARLLNCRSAKRIEHGITRLRRYGMVRVHYRGAGPLIERRVEIATTGQLTGWSSPPPAPRSREPIPKAIVLVFERPTWAGLMRGRRFEDVKFRPKTAQKPAANMQNPGKTNADLRTKGLGLC